ncbi:methyltransferase [Sporichthya polymorpha]|uniref:methyltransferase n=1 Tax=Sporichthya polymorpha TaxID=35751 RepID=UPI000369CA0E|nr:methyltransferase [Sporichthya polymorpha]
MDRNVTPDAILQLGFGFWGAKTLLSAVELGVFTALADGPKPLPALSAEFGLHPRSAVDFFDALVALGMLTRDENGYANTPATGAFLDRNSPTYVGGILEMANARLYHHWGNLTEALRTGEPQNEAKGGDEDLFGALYSDPDRLRQFLRAMTGASLGPAHALAGAFPWKDYASFLDVGCAQGAVPVALARAHPHLTGSGFDLPAVESIFTEYVTEHGVADRVTFSGGDFFTDDLPTADVLVMGRILHDWPFETKFELLGKAYDALPEGGALIVYDTLIDDDRRENAFGLLMSLNMLIETKGGFDYTGKDCTGWMTLVGFTETRVQHLAGPVSMVVGIK